MIERIRNKIAMLLISVGIFAVNAQAINPAEYRNNVEEARKIVAEMLASVAAAEQGNQNYTADEKNAARIKNLIGVSSRIETSSGTVETSNQWLHDRLQEFGKQSDQNTRAIILTDIEERLAAISWKVTELETAAANNRTKDEDKQKLAEILRREEFQKPVQQEESWLQKMFTRVLDWFASLFPRPTLANPNPGGFGGLAYALQILIFAALIGLVGFGVYKFAPILVPSLKRKKQTKKEDRVILGERIAADESASDLFKEAEKMAREGELRGAIRKGYIAVLCELSDRKLIGLALHKTNRDYLRDVRQRRELLDSMRGLTGNFEAHWYGLKEAESADWEQFREEYGRIVRSVGTS
ncbi:MAG: DUF4129 domain-containing protein [Blastocatellia bacterium]